MESAGLRECTVEAVNYAGKRAIINIIKIINIMNIINNK